MKPTVPPQDLKAEMALLGSLCFSNDTFDEVAPIVSADHFYLRPNREVFEAIRRLRSASKPFDAVTVAEELEKAGVLRDVGGYEFLQEVIESVPHAAHAKFYAEAVRERAMRREAISAASELGRRAYDLGDDLQAAVAEAEKRLHGVIESQVVNAATPISEVGLAFLNSLDQPDPVGLPTGLDSLDGMAPAGAGQLIIVAARPSVGKSALLETIGLSVAQNGLTVLLASLEQPRMDVLKRYVCGETGFHMKYLGKPSAIKPADRELIEGAANKIAGLPLVVMDGQPRTVAQIHAQARLLKRQSHLGAVLVDYLQLLTPPVRASVREAEVAEFSRGLKAMAMDLGVPVFCAAQLNRAVEGRDDRRPKLSDLRESGAIEQDADIVIFLNRPGTYDPAKPKSEARLYVAKHRNGQTGEIPLVYLENKFRFIDPSLEHGGFF